MVTVQSQVEVCVMSSQRKSLASTLDTQETWTQRSGQSGSVLNGLVKPPSVPTGGSDFSKVRRGAWPCFLILVCFACRVSLMTRSLYRDESWVADSVLSPSLGGMFHFEKWLQTTPPLFLLLVRGVVSIFGNSEIALRAVPWFAGLLSVVFVARTLARLFPAALAILGTSLFLSNYWAVKYSQQVKQYSTDVLISSLFLFLVTEFLCNRKKRPIIYWALVFAGLGVFLSFTAVFWFPVGLLVIALANRDSAHSNLPELRSHFVNRFRDCLTMLVIYAGSFGLVYIFFVRPNRSGSLVQFWIDQFIGSGGLIPSLLRFFQNLCDLMLPQQFAWSRFFSYACGLFVLAGLSRALACPARRRQTRSEHPRGSTSCFHRLDCKLLPPISPADQAADDSLASSNLHPVARLCARTTLGSVDCEGRRSDIGPHHRIAYHNHLYGCRCPECICGREKSRERR